MSSVEYLGEFVNEQLTTAAKEIFGVFKRIIAEYEEEIDRQRRLLDIIWKPEVKLHRIELPQHHVCKEEEEVLSEQQLCIQEMNSSVEQEEPPQIKEEQEELCTSQEGEQLVLKQETDAFMLTHTYEESDHGDDQTLYFNPEKCLSAEQTEPPANVCGCEASGPNGDHRILLHNPHVAERHDQKGDKHGESPANVGLKLQNQHHKSNSHYGDTHTDRRPFKCGMCGRAFKCKSDLKRHLITHTGQKPYSCDTCGKDFGRNGDLIVHVRRIHTGEKPYRCKICGKRCCDSSDLAKHNTSHKGKGGGLVFARYVGDD